jgi:hypothetical protein
MPVGFFISPDWVFLPVPVLVPRLPSLLRTDRMRHRHFPEALSMAHQPSQPVHGPRA